MQLSIRLFLGIIGGLLAWGRASVVLAHEGETHLGEGFVLTPLIIAVIGGTAGGLLLAGFLVWFWAWRSLKRKEEQKRDLSLFASKQ